MFLGLVLALASILLFLSLVTYHPADPSIDTAADAALSPGVQNWIGLFGAGFSDLALQFLGLTAFLVPLWMGSLGWGWMRSRSRGTVWLRCLGSILAVLFTPAVFWRVARHRRGLEA
jgi:S-DNA-T family DNA segregation ATPase FtsK/SpoIIIE